MVSICSPIWWGRKHLKVFLFSWIGVGCFCFANFVDPWRSFQSWFFLATVITIQILFAIVVCSIYHWSLGRYWRKTFCVYVAYFLAEVTTLISTDELDEGTCIALHFDLLICFEVLTCWVPQHRHTLMSPHATFLPFWASVIRISNNTRCALHFNV